MSAYEEHLKQIAMLLHDFMSRNRCTFEAFKNSHFGWSRWERCVKKGKGKFPEYLTILYAIRMADCQHSQSFCDETEQLTNDIFAIARSLSFEEMGIAVKEFSNCNNKQQRRL